MHLPTIGLPPPCAHRQTCQLWKSGRSTDASNAGLRNAHPVLFTRIVQGTLMSNSKGLGVQHRSWPAAVLLALVLGGCALIPGPAASTPSGAAPTPGGRIVAGTFIPGISLNPLLLTLTGDQNLANVIYASLIDYDASGAPIPGLAEQFSIAPDGKTVTYTLRNGLMWSDGSPLTVDDVRFTIEAALRSKASPVREVFQDIIGAEDYRAGRAPSIAGVDASGRTVTLHLEQPYCPALINIGEIGIIPRSVFGKYMDPADPSRTIDAAPENSA